MHEVLAPAGLLRLPALNLVPQRGIPRILHQTYRHLPLPAEFDACAQRLKVHNPHWDCRLYDDSACEAFVAEHYGQEVLAIYRLIRPEYGVAKADLFRYLVVYRLGGVYLDIKSGASGPLDRLLRDDGKMWLAHWRTESGESHDGWGNHPEYVGFGKRELVQWFLAAPAGHPYLRAVILKALTNLVSYSPWRHGVGTKGVLKTTGPIAFTQAIYPLLRDEYHELCNSAEELGLVYSQLDQAGERRHVSLFGKHYTQRTEAVVELRGTAWLTYPLWQVWRSITWRFDR